MSITCNLTLGEVENVPAILRIGKIGHFLKSIIGGCRQRDKQKSPICSFGFFLNMIIALNRVFVPVGFCRPLIRAKP